MKSLDEYIEKFEKMPKHKPYKLADGRTAVPVAQILSPKEVAQIEEWLKELKAYRDFKAVLYSKCDEWCKFPEYKESGTMCGACEIGGIKDLLEVALEEVKADGTCN